MIEGVKPAVKSSRMRIEYRISLVTLRKARIEANSDSEVGWLNGVDGITVRKLDLRPSILPTKKSLNQLTWSLILVK